MSSRKNTQKNIVVAKGIKYLDNTAIEEYVSEDPIMSNSLELIKDILIREKCKEKKHPVP